MEIAKRLSIRLFRWEYVWLCLLVVATLLMHFSVIRLADQPMFDEQHYVADARSILQGHGTLRFEHPPLGKLFIVAGIAIFGDNPIGWRFFSVACGTTSIVFFYLICRRLSMSKTASFLATFLLALENLTFIQNSVAMLDVYSVTFMIIGFWFYLRGNYLLSGVSVGLSTLAKLTGALVLGVILLHWLIARRDHYRKFIGLVLLAPVSFVFLMPALEYPMFHFFANPIVEIRTMLKLSASLTFATVSHGSAARPWVWILEHQTIPYWVNPNYFGAISYSVWPLIIPTVLCLVFRVVRHNDAGLFGVSWFVSTYLVWIPIVLITNRVTYPYYFYPTVGAICIGLGLVLGQLVNSWRTRRTGKLRWVAISIAGLYLTAHTLVFAFLSPLSYFWGIPFFD
jgi:dolichyl-phosphate-mannose-protein mannosyltransferase